MLDGLVVYDITYTYHDDDGLWGVPSNLSEVFGTREVLGEFECSAFVREATIAICEFYILDADMGQLVERWVAS